MTPLLLHDVFCKSVELLLSDFDLLVDELVGHLQLPLILLIQQLNLMQLHLRMLRLLMFRRHVFYQRSTSQ